MNTARNDTTSSSDTAAIGLFNTSARAFTAARPIRKPVNDPGPETTAKAPMAVLMNPLPREQLGDLGNKLRGKSAAGQRRNLDHFKVAAIGSGLPGSRQRDAALLAGSIDGEKKHERILSALSVKIRENPWPI